MLSTLTAAVMHRPLLLALSNLELRFVVLVAAAAFAGIPCALLGFGFAGVLYANLALQASVRGMQLALDVLRKNGQVGDANALAVDFSERQRLVGKDAFDALEQKYKV